MCGAKYVQYVRTHSRYEHLHRKLENSPRSDTVTPPHTHTVDTWRTAQMVEANGDVYEGVWGRDQPNGTGVRTSAAGQVKQGEWVNGVLSAASFTMTTSITESTVSLGSKK